MDDAKIKALEARLAELENKSNADDEHSIDAHELITRVVGQDTIPGAVSLVDNARHAAEAMASRSRIDEDDDTDYSRFAAFEFPSGVPTHLPATFNPRDVNWTQEWARRAVYTPRYRSELQEARMLLNAGAWHERSMLAFGLAKELCTASGVRNGTLEELFDIVSKSMEVTYEALRERRDYLSYRAIDAAGAEHLERITAAEKISNRMRPAARRHRKTLVTKIVEAETKIIANKHAGNNIGTANGKRQNHDLSGPSSGGKRPPSVGPGGKNNKAPSDPSGSNSRNISKGPEKATGGARKADASDGQ